MSAHHHYHHSFLGGVGGVGWGHLDRGEAEESADSCESFTYLNDVLSQCEI